MTNIFSPQEILRIAVKVEERGENLYAALEAKSTNDKLKKLWKYLKEQEDLHRQIFQEMLEKVGDYIVYEFNPGEYESYLRAISSQYIITQELIEKKTEELFASDMEAIDFAIGIEKDSILTYTTLRDYVLSEKQSILDKVIREEKKHLAQLFLLREENKEE